MFKFIKSQCHSYIWLITSTISTIRDLLSNYFKKLPIEYKNFKYKIKHIKTTNVTLAQYHWTQGNYRDAIFRFNFIKLFLPSCYKNRYIFYKAICFFQLKKYRKTLIYLNKYIQVENIKNHSEYQEEIIYLQNILQNKYDIIFKIPTNFLKRNINWELIHIQKNKRFNIFQENKQINFERCLFLLEYLSNVNHYTLIRKFLTENNTSILNISFSYLHNDDLFNDIFCSHNITHATIFQEQLLQKKSNLYKYVYLDSYNHLLNELKAKYNIIICSNLFNYFSNIDQILEQLFMINDTQSIIVLSFTLYSTVHPNEQEKDIYFDSITHEFEYSKSHILNIINNFIIKYPQYNLLKDQEMIYENHHRYFMILQKLA